MASLRELQTSFAAALRDPARDCAVSPLANLSIYRNNARHAFRATLESSFPVVRRRVGDEYFGQLVHHYRERFPSRSGDLHFAGANFAGFLVDYLRGSDYAWLADLALIEWSREEALISPELPAIGAEVLARFVPEQLEDLVFTFQPALRLHSSPYPVFSIWLANQSPGAPPVDQSKGPEAGMVLLRAESLEIRLLAPRLFSYLYALAAGAPLGEAMERAELDGDALSESLAFVFKEGLVTNLTLKSGPRSPNA
jgi:hypothetical protein